MHYSYGLGVLRRNLFGTSLREVSLPSTKLHSSIIVSTAPFVLPNTGLISCAWMNFSFSSTILASTRRSSSSTSSFVDPNTIVGTLFVWLKSSSSRIALSSGPCIARISKPSLTFSWRICSNSVCSRLSRPTSPRRRINSNEGSFGWITDWVVCPFKSKASTFCATGP